jgi:YebC/PmpR family DNA-binding regulatory protein
MAGHSKWANIKHKKARTDAKKGKAFSRVTKEIITAVKLGGPDPKSNQRLKLAVQKAKVVNMPSDTVDRNIKKASSQDQNGYDEVTYEIYGVGGVGIYCEALTDNKNRLSSDMRIVSNKTEATIATPGSVAFNFERKGVIQIPRKNAVEDDLFLLVSDAGATDFEVHEEGYVVLTEPQDLHAVCDVLHHHSISYEEAELEMLPKSLIECSEEEKEANMAIIERLEDLDDIDQVYHNMQL